MRRLANLGPLRLYWAGRRLAYPGVYVWPGSRLGSRTGLVRVIPFPRSKP